MSPKFFGVFFTDTTAICEDVCFPSRLPASCRGTLLPVKTMGVVEHETLQCTGVVRSIDIDESKMSHPLGTRKPLLETTNF